MTVELLVQRRWSSLQAVVGEMFVNGKHQCYTLEDPPRGVKIPKITGIPEGRYEVKLTWSDKFQAEMPLVVGVPGFTGIRIHWGNTAIDTEGCLLVGKERGANEIFHSLTAYADLFAILEKAVALGEQIFLTIQGVEQTTC